MRKTLLLLPLLLLLAASGAYGQEEPEYRMEAGAGLGLVSYEGDYNGNIAKQPQPLGSLVAKYRLNPRMAWGLNVSLGQLKGSSANVKTWYVGQQPEEPYAFSHRLVDVGLRYEYNFWPYGTGREYLGARQLTPFIALGLGATYAKADRSVLTGNVPLGIGLKWKAAERLNVTLDWAVRFSGSDRLDGKADPYGIRSSGLFKNTDCYSALQVAVTYDFWAKCKTCNSDRD